MIPATLASLANDLHQAAARRCYADVQRLAVRLGAAAAEATGTLPAGDPAREEIAAWLKQRFESAEILVRIGRAAQADEFRRMVFLRRYLPQGGGPASRVRLQL